MASPNPYTKGRSPPNLARESPPISSVQPAPRTSCSSSFLCKSVFFALFLLALPLFPSQAPDFVGETVFTKFWELIHLLFVGIAVSYGLFSRRNADSGVELQLRTSNVDESSLSYLSRMFHVSSFFDYESEFGQRNENRSVKVSIPTSESRLESFVAESQVDDSVEYGKISQVQAWNSQYFQGRSKVVVAQPSYGIDGYTGHKPLGLPVRSLRSALRDIQAPEGNCLSPNLVGGVREDFGSSGYVESKEKFDEARAPSSPVPRQSRSEKMAVRDNLRGGTYHSNLTPLPDDEPQFETLKSGSVRSISSSSTQGSFVSHTHSRFSPSHSASADSLNSNAEELGEEQSLHGSSRSSSPPLSPSPSPPLLSPKSVTDDTHRRLSHSRHYSEGSLFEEAGRRGLEEELDGGNKLRGRRTDFLTRKEPGSRSLKLTGEDFRKGCSSRKSYPPDSVSHTLGGGDSPTRWHPQQKSLLEDTMGRSWEEDPNHLREKLKNNSQKRVGVNQGSLETETDGYDQDRKLHESSPQGALSPPMSDKVSSNVTDARLEGCGSSQDKDVKRNPEDDSMNFGRSRRSDRHGNKELKAGTNLRWESNSGKAGNKASAIGRSVRTVRSSRYAKDLNEEGETSDGWAEHRGRTKSRNQRQDDNVPNETNTENLGQTRAKSKPRYFEDRNGKGKQASKSYIMMDDDGDEQEKEEKEAEEPRVRIEEESGRGSVSDAGTDPNEVDRKAGEFIAKFREQIRLQKLTSGELPRGIGNIGGGGHFR
ncbi:PREDICTED: uncharacterized protein LOC104802490 [Tarenaya hassleriana]|uniref:uncharacterized protein LOC104802490 n=1 Tax=Tarenaya hassleriana TaxID=28532 RepID=UPI00053C8CB9|nr:PREDICTED: uncharacterized protein LOC104802490 [Tarenaya hassleriana]